MGFSPFNLFLGLNSAEASISGSKHNPSPWGKDFKIKYHTKGVIFAPGTSVISWRTPENRFWIDWDAYTTIQNSFISMSVAIMATPPQPPWKTMKWSTALTIGTQFSIHPIDGYPIQDLYENTFGRIPAGPWNIGFVLRAIVGQPDTAWVTKWHRQLITELFP